MKKNAKFNKTVLKNGLRIVTVPMRSNQTVTVLVLVEAGSKYEPKEINGISHFLEHLCFKGTSKRPKAADISYALDSIGSQSNAFTGQEYTGYYAKSHHKNLPEIIDVISDIFINPTFPEKELEKEKGVVVEEINMYEDLPHTRVWDVFTDLLYGDQPAGRTILGSKKAIHSINRKDVINYRKKHYVAQGTVVVIAGKFDEKKAKTEVIRAFSNISSSKKHKKPKVQERQIAPQLKFYKKKTDQTHMVLGFRSEDMYSSDRWPLSLLSAILGGGMSSRLFQKLREDLGLCYYVRSAQNSYTDHGHFTISAGTGHSRTLEAIEAVLEEVRKVSTTKVGERELKKAKQFVLGNFSLGLESSDELADYYGFQALFKKKTLLPDEVSQNIQKVKAEDVLRAARKVFQNKHLNLALVGPINKGQEKRIEKLLRL